MSKSLSSGVGVAALILCSPVVAQSNTVCSAVMTASAYAQESSRVELWHYDGDTLTEPTLVYQSDKRNSGSVVAHDADGKVFVVWVENSKSRSRLNYRIRGANGKWNDVSWLDETSSELTAPTIIFDGVDTVHLAWVSGEGGDDDIYLSKFVAGAWAEKQQVNTSNSVPDILPRLGISAAGDLQVTWRGFYMNSMSYQLYDKELGVSLGPDALAAAKEVDCATELAGMALPNAPEPLFINYPQDILNSYQAPYDQ